MELTYAEKQDTFYLLLCSNSIKTQHTVRFYIYKPWRLSPVSDFQLNMSLDLAREDTKSCRQRCTKGQRTAQALLCMSCNLLLDALAQPPTNSQPVCSSTDVPEPEFLIRFSSLLKPQGTNTFCCSLKVKHIASLGRVAQLSKGSSVQIQTSYSSFFISLPRPPARYRSNARQQIITSG